ncbi:DNA-damage-inducible protein J [Streptococcus agalactiae]|nr:DNA-damage-inducible protein J [Streptococcus agalactiae str. Gottschalk 992B]EPU52770.1 DNA-damage-inducible protein J [Streptococcus agalactiae str. Gottschalk 1005B]EPW26640.1 DNA-damage-inducible protein J [Streptococcus agalactiae CCUG 37740]CFQ78515.1 DNA-damage-inducible protein J [Streptococcus agalactiae]CFR04043.1 DNA-damage-inducible protein J [Streptococcus agalactiae]
MHRISISYTKKGKMICMSTVAVRVDDQLKDDATKLFQSLGLDMSTAVKMFLIQSVKTQSIPFEIKNNPSILVEELQNKEF